MIKLNFSLLKNPLILLGLGFGSGLSPVAPGTVGTLVAWLLAFFFPFLLHGTVVILACLAGIYICGYTARHLKTHDHPGIVWDEFCGIWITLAIVDQFYDITFPVHASGNHLNLVLWWLAALISFRIFDILKPWPVGYIDRKVKGGLGIMLDDIVAAFLALIPLIPGLYLLGLVEK